MPPLTQFWRGHSPTGHAIWQAILHFALSSLGHFIVVNLALDFTFAAGYPRLFETWLETLVSLPSPAVRSTPTTRRFVI
jgi:hypothetical protein